MIRSELNHTTSTGVLERPYCQMEIRQAIALKKPVVLLHEVSEWALSVEALDCS